MCYSNILTLTGLPASGKTTIGKLLAKQLEYKFIDLDQHIIQKYNVSIKYIFHTFGEPQFREYETLALTSIFNSFKKNLVLSLGGGTICFNNNLKLCLNNSLVIWLNTALHIIKDRLINNFLINQQDRPIFNNTNITSKLKKLYKERVSFYKQCNLKVNIKDINCNKYITQIINFLHSYGT